MDLVKNMWKADYRARRMIGLDMDHGTERAILQQLGSASNALSASQRDKYFAAAREFCGCSYAKASCRLGRTAREVLEQYRPALFLRQTFKCKFNPKSYSRVSTNKGVIFATFEVAK